RPWQESVVYELHIGTFTPEGTFRAAIEKLPTLAETGITMIEVLPVSQFGGNRGHISFCIEQADNIGIAPLAGFTWQRLIHRRVVGILKGH
ncbi:hypothetical protein, partial [Pseudomonas sp. SIMBA_068]|uniref:hypothetical protein n=1 Tax=Pseudomonas sp. SIMBA_068 TaxID=3085808 RepID=UPI00397BAC6A